MAAIREKGSPPGEGLCDNEKEKGKKKIEKERGLHIAMVPGTDYAEQRKRGEAGEGLKIPRRRLGKARQRLEMEDDEQIENRKVLTISA